MNTMKYIFIILAVLAGFAHGFDFADFVNDLYSDLAPLLTLLGEKVATQYISQAIGYGDCLALALAPLGIITIMVSAIRVGGPTVLKAIVGRAKENMAAAELELMSSTSREVCELFNGQNIIRCLGSGSVWQYVCLFRKGAGSGHVKFMTLQQAVREGLLIRTEGKTDKKTEEGARSSQGGNHEGKPTGTATGFDTRKQTTIQKLQKRVRKFGLRKNTETCLELGLTHTTQQPGKKTDGDSAEKGVGDLAMTIVIYDAVPEAPNISLNLQHVGNQQTVWVAVILGFFLQTAVLVFFCLIRYDLKVQTFLKIDKPLSPYGFLMALGGTVLMAIGMFLCANVVERSTVEEVYEANDQFSMQLYWLQQDQTVSDQVFQSFATFPDRCSTNFWKSRRAGSSQDDQTVKNLKIKTWLGVGFSFVGFVVQFVGFRGFHPAAPLAQLVAILIMTVCRAVVRPGFTKNFGNVKLLHGFEQDWLAHVLAQQLTKQLAHHQLPQQTAQSIDNGDKKQCAWSIATGRDAEYGTLEILHKETLRENTVNHGLYSEAQRLLVMRRGLCKLAKFRTVSSKCAAKLATTMEKALGVLFPDGPRGGLGFRWVLDVAMGRAMQSVWIDLLFHQGDKGCWRVAPEDLHAVLSLWMYTARVQEDGKKGSGYVEDEDGAWLCRDVCEPSLKALGEGNYNIRNQVIQDLKTWTTQSYDAVREIEAIWRREKARAENESGRRLKPNCARPADGDPRTRLGSRAAETDGSLVDLYASDLLFTFMWSMARTLRVRVEGEVEVETAHDASGFAPQGMNRLRDTAVTDLINAFRAASCWSDHETCLGVISPLSLMHKLPIPQQWFNTISTTIKESLKSRNPVAVEEAWEQAFAWARRLIQVCANSSTSDRVVAWLLEQFHDFQDAEERAYEIPSLERTATGCAYQTLGRLIMRGAGKNTPTDVVYEISALGGTEGPGVYFLEPPRRLIFLRHMENLYELQGREMKFEFDETRHTPELPACFDFTTLHEEAASGKLSSSYELDKQRIFVNVQDVCGWTPLLYAVSNKNWNMVESLLEMGADPKLTDHRGYTAAHHACLSGCLESLKRLSDKTAMDAQAMNGLRPIHLAAGKGNHDIIKFLLHSHARFRAHLETGATADTFPTLKDFDGRTAAHWAAAGGHSQVVELLRAHVNIPDDHGSTPLHLAAMGGNLATVEKLLMVGAKVNVTNDRGETPLVCCLDWAKTEEDASRVTEALVGHLRFESIDVTGAIDIAKKRGFDSVATYLGAQMGGLNGWMSWGVNIWAGEG